MAGAALEGGNPKRRSGGRSRFGPGAECGVVAPHGSTNFHLDGTLVDSVCAHVLARQLAFAEAGMPIDGWRLHRRMGMSGGLFKRRGDCPTTPSPTVW
jgi:hypothetical protein